MNAIFAYTLAGLLYTVFYSKKLWGISLSATFVDEAMAIGVAPKLASLLYALFYVLVIWFPTYQLFKRKIYQMRLLGLISSMIGKNSYHRPNL